MGIVSICYKLRETNDRILDKLNSGRYITKSVFRKSSNICNKLAQDMDQPSYSIKFVMVQKKIIFLYVFHFEFYSGPKAYELSQYWLYKMGISY